MGECRGGRRDGHPRGKGCDVWARCGKGCACEARQQQGLHMCGQTGLQGVRLRRAFASAPLHCRTPQPCSRRSSRQSLPPRISQHGTRHRCQSSSSSIHALCTFAHGAAHRDNNALTLRHAIALLVHHLDFCAGVRELFVVLDLSMEKSSHECVGVWQGARGLL